MGHLIRTWSKLGEHGEHGLHRKDEKHQPDELKHSNYDSKHSICDSKHFFWQPDNSKHFILRLLCRRLLGEHEPGSAQNGRTSSEM